MQRRVLIAAYGGGHVQSLIPVAHALQREAPEVQLTVLGFTTARAAFERAGLDTQSYTSLLTPEDAPWRRAVAPHLPDTTHPDITAEETEAYFAIGLRDLVLAHGESAALERLEREQRKAFLPVQTFTRYLREEGFDLAITSTSPRSELAVQRAARALGLPGIAVSDLFLQHEASYICRPDYAPDVTVICDYVACHLREAGLPDDHRLHITGNPAFDGLGDAQHADAGRALRRRLGIGEQQRLITFICPGASRSLVGKQFQSPQAVTAFLARFCELESDREYRFLLRQHPSAPFEIDTSPFGLVCPTGVDIEACITASDVLVMEASTVGMQAALIGKPVITIAADGYPPYAALGVSTDVPNLEAAADAIRHAQPPDLARLGYPALGTATQRVLSLVRDKLGLTPDRRTPSSPSSASAHP